MSTRESLDLGSVANDPSADTLRSGGQKIENNFTALWLHLGGDSDTLSTSVSFVDDAVVFDGATLDANVTQLVATDPTGINVISLPDYTGSIVLDSSSDTLLNKILTSPVIQSPIISTEIKDSNDVSILGISPTTSAVNYITLSNSSTGLRPSVAATGTDSSVGIDIITIGTGAVNMSKGSYSVSVVSGSGNIPQDKSFIAFSSGSALAMTLLDGETTGEFKKFVNRSTGVATVTPSNFANGTSFALAQNEGCEAIWDGTNWFIIANQSVLSIV